MDFFDKKLSAQDMILETTHYGYKVVNANIEKGQISIHTSRVYHSSGPNISKGPRIGMVVHFCTDLSKKIPVKGELTSYLNQTENESICPVIYEN